MISHQRWILWIGAVLLAIGWILAPTGDPTDILITMPLLTLVGVATTGWLIIAGYIMIGIGLYLTRGKIL